MSSIEDPQAEATWRSGSRRCFALCLALVFLAACAEEPTGNESQRRADARSIEIVPYSVDFLADTTHIEAVGTARARQSATLYPDTGGEVAAVGFEGGELVSAGDILLSLDARAARLAVKRAQVSVREAEQLVQRYRKLSSPNAIAESQVDDAQIALDSAKVELQLAEVALAERTVRAPFDGYVGLSELDPGTRISPQTPITQLDDRRVLFVDFAVPEQVFGRIAAGETIGMSPFSDPAGSYQATVDRIDSRVDPGTRSFTVRARLDNADDKLRPGMSFLIEFELPGQRYPAVPEAAIVWGGDGAYLWAVKEGRATRVPLTIISRQNGLVLVRAALAEGSTIVAEGVQKVREGTRVTEGYANREPGAAYIGVAAQ